MATQRFDIWLHAFATNSEEPGPVAMSRLFGIPPQVAEGLLNALPRVVRRDAEVLQAQRIVAALESIGGRADMVACPLRPAPVLIIGQSSGEPAREGQDAASFAPLGSSETLMLGTQELAAFGFSAQQQASTPSISDTVLEPRAREVTVREVEAPSASPWQSLPGAPPSSPSFVVTRDLRAWIDTGVPLDASAEPARLSLVPIASSAVLDLEERLQVRLLTALPADHALPPIAETLRRPNARAFEPKRHPSSTAPAAPKLEAKRLLESVRAPLQSARGGAWPSVLTGHPALGFWLVLASVTFAFWLLAVAVR
jgi:hypothetical protein